MKRLPILLLLSLCACPTPKAGDDRLPLGDAGEEVDAGKELTDAGPDGPDGSTPGPDAGDDAGMPAPDSGETVDTGLPECVPTGPEDCTNGIDDDCQNGADCNDPACGTCVPIVAGFTMGLIATTREACPAGFDVQETPIFSGLEPGPGCTGCSCSANPTECVGELFIYATEADCNLDTLLIGGLPYNMPINTQCTMKPVAFGFPGGYRWGSWNIQQSCAVSGSASPTPYSWAQQAKFCTAQVGLQGCDAGSVCVPAAERACLLTAGAATCPEPFSTANPDWFMGVNDARTCGPCSCGAAGGGCQNAQIALGSDYVCTDGAFVSEASPRSCGSAYSPPARVIGMPTAPTCTPMSTVNGTIEGTDQHTACCMP